MLDVNDALISVLQKVEADTREKKQHHRPINKPDDLYYQIAIQHNYLETYLGITQVWLTKNGKLALSNLIKARDREGRELERHEREKQLLKSNTFSAYCSGISSIILFCTLITMLWNSDKTTMLQQPVQIEILSPMTPSVQPSHICNPDTDCHKDTTNQYDRDPCKENK